MILLLKFTDLVNGHGEINPLKVQFILVLLILGNTLCIPEAGCKAARIDHLKHCKSSFLMFTTALES